MKRLAVVFLVDRRGWILLQERDSGAPVAPDKWGMVGGHVEPGETDAAAAHRELGEETGLTLAADELSPWIVAEFSYQDGPSGHYSIYAAAVDLTDSDISVGEGRQIVFVDPARIPLLDQTESCAHFLPQFLNSDLYAELRGAH